MENIQNIGKIPLLEFLIILDSSAQIFFEL